MSSFESSSAGLAAPRFVPDASARDTSFRTLPEPRQAAPDEPADDVGSGEDGAAVTAPSPAPAPDPEIELREAFERGVAAGRAELSPQEIEALESAIAALEHAAHELADLRCRYLTDNRRAAVELALVVAERILARELGRDPEALSSFVERALAGLDGDAPVRVQLSAQDHETLRAGRAAALERLCSAPDMAIEAHAELAPGEVLIETPRSRVDARLPELLRRVREEIDAGLDAAEESA